MQTLSVEIEGLVLRSFDGLQSARAVCIVHKTIVSLCTSVSGRQQHHLLNLGTRTHDAIVMVQRWTHIHRHMP